MLHRADVRSAGDLWRSWSGLHLKSRFLHQLVLLVFHQSAFIANLTLSGASNKVAYNRWGLNLLLEGRTFVVAFHGWVAIMAGHRLHSGIFKPWCLQDRHRGGSQTMRSVDSSQSCFFGHLRKKVLQLVFSKRCIAVPDILELHGWISSLCEFLVSAKELDIAKLRFDK